MQMSWSPSALDAINDIKKTILKKKVLLNIIIESYSWYDKVFRYVHMMIAVGTPLISFTEQMVSASTERTSTIVVILSSVVAGMIKLKEYLKFTKLKDQSKQQSVKYQQLYQRIEREMRKQTGKQNEEDFISWVSRELSIIEVDDPDVPQRLKKVFIDVCKEKGIPYDEDLAALDELFSVKIGGEVLPTPAEKKEICITVEPDEPEKPAQPVRPIKPDILIKQQPSVYNQFRTPSVEEERQNYKTQVATFDPTQDTSWALERLATIETAPES
jgi:hypothetical protein